MRKNNFTILKAEQKKTEYKRSLFVLFKITSFFETSPITNLFFKLYCVYFSVFRLIDIWLFFEFKSHTQLPVLKLKLSHLLYAYMRSNLSWKCTVFRSFTYWHGKHYKSFREGSDQFYFNSFFLCEKINKLKIKI